MGVGRVQGLRSSSCWAHRGRRCYSQSVKLTLLSPGRGESSGAVELMALMGYKSSTAGQQLAALAHRQHGVVSIRQLQRLGYSHKSVRRAIAAGRLHRLHQGVFAVGHTNLSLQGRCLAGVLASGPGSLLSHFSAGWLLGLMATRPIPVHVTTPVPRKRRGSLRVHRSGTLIDADRALEQGIPVTSVARTALDLAAGIRFRTLRRVIRRSEELEVFDLADFRSVLDRNRGHRGASRLARAVAVYEPPRFTRSELEREFLRLIETAGLPMPSTAFLVAGYELDVYWPELRFGSNWTSTKPTVGTSRSRRTAAVTRT